MSLIMPFAHLFVPLRLKSRSSCSKRKRNEFESCISANLEPLDKGRLSLGDEGDAFRAKRGKKAGFRDEEFELARL